MAKKNESKKLVKGMAKELQYIMDIENLLCTFLSLDNEEKLNELLGNIKNKKGADAWFNKVIKNTAHLIGDDNFKEEFETYVNTNRASLTDIIVNYDSSVTEKTLKDFLNNTTTEEKSKDDKEVESKNELEVIEEDVEITYAEALKIVLPEKLFSKLPKTILNRPMDKDMDISEDVITEMVPFIALYMKTADLNKLEEFSNKIDSMDLTLSNGLDLFEMITKYGFEEVMNEKFDECKAMFEEDDIKFFELLITDLGMSVVGDFAKTMAQAYAFESGNKISDKELDEKMIQLKETYTKIIENLRTPGLNDGKDFKIKVLDREIEVKGSKWNHEILSNAKEAIVEEFELFGSGIAMFDHSMDLVLEAIESNKGKWSDECYMSVFDKILSTERKPFTLKIVKSLTIK